MSVWALLGLEARGQGVSSWTSSSVSCFSILAWRWWPFTAAAESRVYSGLLFGSVDTPHLVSFACTLLISGSVAAQISPHRAQLSSDGYEIGVISRFRVTLKALLGATDAGTSR